MIVLGRGEIRNFVPAYGRLGAVTDDTQMTLFTAEGMLRAFTRYADRGICHPPAVVHRAYMRWLKTQGGVPASLDSEIGLMAGLSVSEPSGLGARRGLHAYRPCAIPNVWESPQRTIAKAAAA